MSTAAYTSWRNPTDAIRLLAKNLYIEWAVKEDDKQARLATCGLVSHWLSGCEVGITGRSDSLVVGFEPSFEDDDRVRGCVPMRATYEAGRITDKVVLLTGVGILIKQPQADCLIVYCGGSFFRVLQLERLEFIDDGCTTVLHARLLLDAILVSPTAISQAPAF